MTHSVDDVQAFFGELNEHTARVYATIDGLCGSERYRLSGEVRGPFSAAGVTLPAAFKMSHVPGETLLCAAVVTDPCFWVSNQPAIYRLKIQLFDDQQLVGETTRQLGFRPLGVRGRSFFFAGRRWVLRAVQAGPDHQTDFARWRETETTVVCDSIDNDFLEQASRQGVRILADLRRHVDPADSLKRVGQFPAVIAAILNRDAAAAIDGEPRRLARNLLLIADGDAAGLAPGQQVRDWADAIWRPVARLADITPDRPVVVWRAADGDDGRRETVDRLQAELAPRGQFAGYAVIN